MGSREPVILDFPEYVSQCSRYFKHDLHSTLVRNCSSDAQRRVCLEWKYHMLFISYFEYYHLANIKHLATPSMVEELACHDMVLPVFIPSSLRSKLLGIHRFWLFLSQNTSVWNIDSFFQRLGLLPQNVGAELSERGLDSLSAVPIGCDATAAASCTSCQTCV